MCSSRSVENDVYPVYLVMRLCTAHTEARRNISFAILHYLQVALGAGAQYEGVQRRTRNVGRSCQIVSNHSLSDFALCLLNQCRFVDRYIPGYVFFGDVQRWQGRGLRLLLDEQRRQLGVETF
jgi:hypothetical protein